MYLPLGNRIIIKKVEEKQEKGIVVPKSAGREEPAIGEITAIGEDIKLKVGDKVVYNDLAGTPMPYEEDLLIIDLKEILCLIK